MNLRPVFVFLILLLPVCVFAQYRNGLKYYANYDYAKAIPLLRKAANKNNADQADATVKLADCYRTTKDYANAELYYTKAKELRKLDPNSQYNYGCVLKNNNKYDQALKEFAEYLAQDPSDVKAKNALKSCNEIKTWQKRPKEYEVTSISGLNTSKSEFCPVLFEDKLVFVSEQKHDLVNYQEYDYDGHPYLNVYFTTLKNEIPGKIHGFSKKVNSNYHDGPVCFSKDNNTLYLTRVNYIVDKKNKDFVNRAKIYKSTRSGNSWSKPEPFQYSSDEYSTAHPSLSEDGNWLFFTSDMNGGYGGNDIYVCKRNGTGWDKPQNLGSDINTSGDEEFPYIRKDGMLFFSSDGLPGFGGLDIFSASQIEEKWILNRNEGLGINSFTDDFGVYFTDNNHGYLSSNRDGGMGSDDIYKFVFTSKYINVDGTILNSNNINDPATNLKILLEDVNGGVITSTRTNEKGYFVFGNLESDKKYLVKIDETDPGFNGKKRFYYADSKNNVMRVTVVNEKGEKFVFRNLPLDPNSLPELYADDDITLAGNLLFGENPSSPVANAKIVLKDASGNIIDEATTNAFGAFVFSKLPPDENYLVELVETDTPLPPNTKIILTNKSGKEIKVARSDAKGGFQFNILASDKTVMKEMSVEDNDLLMNVNGKLFDNTMKVLPGTKVYLLNEKGLAVDTAVTDANGKFEFRNLRADMNYMVSIDENDSKLAALEKLFISDLKGKVVRQLVRDKKNGFKYALLKTDKSELTELYVDDPWLEVLNFQNKQHNEEITIVENVYYAYGDYKLDEAGKLVLDKVTKIMKDHPNIVIELSSHTDSRARDDFNLKLSEKRAKTAVDYIISKGIDKKRLTAIGYGETRLINSCGNNSNCTEEEHAKNRRTEFKVVNKTQ